MDTRIESAPFPGNTERVLADRLKREAEASRPEFSEALHARICEAVRESAPSPGNTAGSRRREAYSPQRYPAYVAVAVAVLVSATLIVWQAIPRSAPQRDPLKVALPQPQEVPGPPHEPAPDPLETLHRLVDGIDSVPERVNETVESTLIGGPWAQLDHDARLAASLLTDPLPLQMLALSPGNTAGSM